MFRMVARESSTARATSAGSERMSTTSADPIATSVPAPMAMPMSARASAGASLMPSPTIATLCPACCSSRTLSSFWSGSTPATTSSTPTLRATASAVRRWSPVSSRVRTPMARRRSTAAALVGLTGSATAISPSTLPEQAKKSGVFPSAASASARSDSPPSSTPRSAIRHALPASASSPPSVARSPPPTTCVKPSAAAGAAATPFFAAYSRTACAKGCSLFCSSAEATARSPCSDLPSASTTSVTEGLPAVTVPVLSMTT